MSKFDFDKVYGRAYEQIFDHRSHDLLYRKLDPYQKKFYECMMQYKVVIVDEPAGTGKTTIAVMAGLEHVRQGKSLIYIRFPSRRAERLGATPGDLLDKERKYMWPFYEAMNELGIQDEAVDVLRANGIVDMRTDTQERGRNLKNSFIIIDEAQNAEDLDQLKLILTRVHDKSCTVVLIGDSRQYDSNVKRYGKQNLSAFQVFQYHMVKKPWAVKCELKNNYRGEVAKWADRVEESLHEI